MVLGNSSVGNKKEWAVYLAAVIILLLPALYNGFPFVTPDTGSYIIYAYKIMVPSDRSLVYSIFILLTSYHLSLWGVLLVQSIVLTFFIHVITRHLSKGFYSPFLFLMVVLLISTGTSAAWFCSQLMPDIFSSILLLAICTLFYVPIQSKWHLYLLLLFIWGATIMHNSHLLITLIVAVVMGILYYIRKEKLLLSRALSLLGISVFSFITMSSMNLISGKGFRPSASTHVFLMSRMVENGIMDNFLNDYCPTEHYKLCDYKNQLGDRQWNFMWDTTSPLYKTGGWKANEQEYNQIIGKTLATPKYLGLQIFKSLEATLRQLPQIEIGDAMVKQPDNSNIATCINEQYHHELREYRSSLQNTDNIKPLYFNILIFLFSLLSILATLYIKAVRTDKTGETSWNHFFNLVIVFILCNAFITATFSTIASRLQSRVFWVLPFICVLYILSYMGNKRVKGTTSEA